MREPTRLRERQAHDVAARLLRTVSSDAPAPGAHDRALAALGLEPAAPQADSDRMSQVVALRRRSGRPWLAGFALAAMVAGVAAHELARDPEPPASATAPIEPSPRASSDRVAVTPKSVPGARGTPPAEPPRPAAKPARVQEPKQSPVAPREDGNLRERRLAREVSALDTVRRAIASKRPSRATTLLDAYAADFPRGALSQEALILRVEALLLSGQRARAEQLARDFLGARSRSGYRARIERLLASDDREERIP